MEEYIVAALEPWRNELALHYQWSFDINVPLEKFGIVIKGENWLEKTLSLKRQLAERVNNYRDNDVELRRIANYFIQVWGVALHVNLDKMPELRRETFTA